MQFRIRELLLLICLVGVIFGWWRSSQERRIRFFSCEIEGVGVEGKLYVLETKKFLPLEIQYRRDNGVWKKAGNVAGGTTTGASWMILMYEPPGQEPSVNVSFNNVTLFNTSRSQHRYSGAFSRGLSEVNIRRGDISNKCDWLDANGKKVKCEFRVVYTE